MSSWLVSGGGSSAYDGLYLESGTHGGKAAYLQVGGSGVWLWYDTGLPAWVISPTKGEIAGNWIYNSTGGTGTLPDNPWTNVVGSLPVPTVTSGGATGNKSISVSFGERGKIFADGLYINAIDTGSSVCVITSEGFYTKTSASVISTNSLRVEVIIFNCNTSGDAVVIKDGSNTNEILTLKSSN